jgi:hypothetical protein
MMQGALPFLVVLVALPSVATAANTPGEESDLLRLGSRKVGWEAGSGFFCWRELTALGGELHAAGSNRCTHFGRGVNLSVTSAQDRLPMCH